MALQELNDGKHKEEVEMKVTVKVIDVKVAYFANVFFFKSKSQIFFKVKVIYMWSERSDIFNLFQNNELKNTGITACFQVYGETAVEVGSLVRETKRGPMNGK